MEDIADEGIFQRSSTDYISGFGISWLFVILPVRKLN
jgi:hypothetical protein